MKKLLMLVCIAVFAMAAFAGCGGEKEILAISRESGSGTRSGFQEVLGLKDSEIDIKSQQDGTAAVVSTVEKNKNAIGYVSLASVGDTVKGLSFDGIKPTVENVKNDSYKLSRPFVLATKKGGTYNEATQDFFKYVMSSNAQEVILSAGLVSVNTGEAYTAPESIEGIVKLEGSTSLESVIKKLIAAYTKLNANVKFETTHNGSGAGITASQEKVGVVGMSSRALNSSEKTTLDETKLCMDGIAVIVNKDNSLDNISKENLVKIYTGKIKKFSEITA